jgi:chaperone BCS1
MICNSSPSQNIGITQGTTSICQVLTGFMRLDICILPLTSTRLSYMRLTNLMLTLSSKSLILLEDLNAIFIDCEKANSNASKLTFSVLLNAIDGIMPKEGNIFIMTTNHIERLDPAFIRPGRCDVNISKLLCAYHAYHAYYA